MGQRPKMLIGQFLRFVIVGVLNTVYGFAVIFACMYWLGLSAYLSNAIGYGCGLITSYVLNRTFTFRSQARARGEVFRFLAVFGVAYLANLALLYGCVQWIGINEGVSQIIAGAAYVVVSFLLNKYYVFQRVQPAA